MSEARVIRFPLKDINSHKTGQKELVDINSITALSQDHPLAETTPALQFQNLSHIEIENLKKDAFEAGVIQGKNESMQEQKANEEKLDTQLSAMSSRIEELDKKRLHTFDELSKEAANLALQVAKKLMSEVSNIHEHRVYKFFEEVLEKIRSEANITITLESSFAHIISDKLNALIAKHNIKSDVKIIPSNEFEFGQCKIDWEFGKAILDPETLLKSLEKDTQAQAATHVEYQNQTLQNMS